MKCLWYCGLAMIMGASMVSPASAQSDWGSPSQIGSYQSILASHQNQDHAHVAPNVGPTGPRGSQPCSSRTCSSRTCNSRPPH